MWPIMFMPMLPQHWFLHSMNHSWNFVIPLVHSPVSSPQRNTLICMLSISIYSRFLFHLMYLKWNMFITTLPYLQIFSEAYFVAEWLKNWPWIPRPWNSPLLWVVASWARDLAHTSLNTVVIPHASFDPSVDGCWLFWEGKLQALTQTYSIFKSRDLPTKGTIPKETDISATLMRCNSLRPFSAPTTCLAFNACYTSLNSLICTEWTNL